jgi:ABC-type glycerol-3-phosphate transport system substrate-binding protein
MYIPGNQKGVPMERREFLFCLGCAVVTAPVVLSIAACGGGGGGGGGTSTSVTGADFTVTSSVNDAHTHEITVKAADLAAGVSVTYTSTNAGGHTHTVTLTPAIINDINSGKGDVVSANPDTTGHSHGWLIKKP